MNKNIIIAKQLVRLANELIAGGKRKPKDVKPSLALTNNNYNYLFCFKKASEEIGQLISDLQNNNNIKRKGCTKFQFKVIHQDTPMGTDAKEPYYLDRDEAEADTEQYYPSYIYCLDGYDSTKENEENEENKDKKKKNKKLYINVNITLLNNGQVKIIMTFDAGNKETEVVNRVIQKEIPFMLESQKKTKFDELVREFKNELEAFVGDNFGKEEWQEKLDEIKKKL